MMTEVGTIVDTRVNTSVDNKPVDYYVDIDGAIIVQDVHQATFCPPGPTEGFSK